MKKPLLWTVVAVLLSIGSTLVIGQSDTRTDVAKPGELSGKLPDGSNYRVVKPERWNGTLQVLPST